MGEGFDRAYTGDVRAESRTPAQQAREIADRWRLNILWLREHAWPVKPS